MKLAEVIDANFNLISLLPRMGMGFGFGDMTVKEACRKYGVDTEVFLLICNIYTFDDYRVPLGSLDRRSLEDIMDYLHNTHSYYMGSVANRLDEMLGRLMTYSDKTVRTVICRFFDDYKVELRRHFEHEENEVFARAAASLRSGDGSKTAAVTCYEGHDCNVGEKLEDLKYILMKYIPSESDPQLVQEVLSLIFTLEEDLRKHEVIEEEVLVPLINSHPDAAPQRLREKACETESLSSREKEILVAVAKGMLNKEIADEFSISIHTVITHRKNITRKTGIKTVSGLTVYALLNGLVDVSDFS